MKEHRRKVMYGLDIFDNIEMSLDWYIIYYGIKNNILDMEVAQEYVLRKMEKDEPVLQEEIELSWKISNQLDVLYLIEQIPEFHMNSEKRMGVAKNKIQIAIIMSLRKNEKDITKLFQRIDMVYADFDYPEDMEKIISYMPISDGYLSAEHTPEDNENRLLRKIDSFICEQITKYQ